MFFHIEPRSERTASETRGFTMIELLVVLAVIGVLLSVVAPRYMAHVDHARDQTLKHGLLTLRDQIDRFYGDKGRYPSALPELVQAGYLRSIPVDPVTGSADTWSTSAAPDGGIRDVHSGAPGVSSDGKPYAEW